MAVIPRGIGFVRYSDPPAGLRDVSEYIQYMVEMIEQAHRLDPYGGDISDLKDAVARIDEALAKVGETLDTLTKGLEDLDKRVAALEAAKPKEVQQ